MNNGADIIMVFQIIGLFIGSIIIWLLAMLFPRVALAVIGAALVSLLWPELDPLMFWTAATLVVIMHFSMDMLALSQYDK
jgi:hypothetical protein